MADADADARAAGDADACATRDADACAEGDVDDAAEVVVAAEAEVAGVDWAGALRETQRMASSERARATRDDQRRGTWVTIARVRGQGLPGQ